MHAYNLQALVRLLNYLVELSLAPLLGALQNHHATVDLPKMMLLGPGNRAGVRQDYVADEQRRPASAPLQGRGPDYPDRAPVFVVV